MWRELHFSLQWSTKSLWFFAWSSIWTTASKVIKKERKKFQHFGNDTKYPISYTFSKYKKESVTSLCLQCSVSTVNRSAQNINEYGGKWRTEHCIRIEVRISTLFYREVKMLSLLKCNIWTSTGYINQLMFTNLENCSFNTRKCTPFPLTSVHSCLLSFDVHSLKHHASFYLFSTCFISSVIQSALLWDVKDDSQCTVGLFVQTD